MTTGSPPQQAPAAWILTPSGASGFEVWGMTPSERLRRSLARAGCNSIRILVDPAPGEAPTEATALLLRADWIYDERLVTALAGAPGTLLVAPETREPVAACVTAPDFQRALEGLRNGTTPQGMQPVEPEQLAPPYIAKLRKSEPPYLYAARAELAREIEDRTFAASYKGATDLVTKWVWPAPARWATRHLAIAQVHPNSVTIASWILAIAAFWLFWQGWFAVGLLAAWVMTFLDTVDGKLARVTLTSSRLGDVLDHGLDLVHPPFWWFAWGVGAGMVSEWPTWVVVGGYFAGRALEGIFLACFKMETHSWRPIDTLFRTVTARRNPNLLLLTVGAAAGRPDLGLLTVALWTLASLAFHTARLVQAALARSRGETIEPWDEERRAPARPRREVVSREGDGRSP